MEIKRLVHAQWNKYSKSFSYDTFAVDMTNYGYIKLEEVTISFDSPTDKELRVHAAHALQANKSRVLADAMTQASEIQKEIDELTSLEYKPDLEEAAVDAASIDVTKGAFDDDLPF